MLRAWLAEPVHDPLQHRLNDPQERALGGVPVPAGFHQLPAFLIEHRETLRANSWKTERDPATINTPQIREKLWCSFLWCRLKWPKRTVWALMLSIEAYISAVPPRHLWERCWSRSGDHTHSQRMANTFSFTGASSSQRFGRKMSTLTYQKSCPIPPPTHNGAFGSKFKVRTSSKCSLLTEYKTYSSELIFFTWEGERLYGQELRTQSSRAFWYRDAAWRIQLPCNTLLH